MYLLLYIYIFSRLYRYVAFVRVFAKKYTQYNYWYTDVIWIFVVQSCKFDETLDPVITCAHKKNLEFLNFNSLEDMGLLKVLKIRVHFFFLLRIRVVRNTETRRTFQRHIATHVPNGTVNQSEGKGKNQEGKGPYGTMRSHERRPLLH